MPDINSTFICHKSNIKIDAINYKKNRNLNT